MSRSRHHVRTVRTLLIALVATALALSAAAAPTGAAPDPSSTTRSTGYATKDFPGWIGAHRLGPDRVYRLNGTRKIAGAYGPARRLATRSPRHVRAAYLLSRYGATVTRTRAAALDAAVLHLLSTSTYRLDGRRGAQRIRQVGGERGTVRNLARQMLSESAAFAGPPTTSLTSSATTASVGQDVTLTFRVSAAGGRPIAGSPVTFAYAGSVIRTATSSSGVATAVVEAEPGTHAVQATALRLHDWQPTVRRSDLGGTGVGVGGVTRTATRAVSITAATQQTVTINPMTPAARPVRAAFGTPQFTIRNGSGTRTVTFTMHAAETRAAAQTCPGASVVPATSRPVTTDSYEGPLPGFAAPRTRYYAWKVTVGGNDTSTAASRCSTAVKAFTTATLAQARTGEHRVRAGSTTGVRVTVGGFDRSERHLLKTSLYGPFDTAAAAAGGCLAAQRVRGPSSTTITSTTTFTPRISAPRAVGKYFTWGTDLDSAASQFIASPATACGQTIRIVR